MVLPTTWSGRMKAQAVRAADKVGPMASNAREGAYSRFEDARVWAAPKLDHAAHSVEDQLAPRLSALLAQTARRVDPTPMKMQTRTNWPSLVLLGGLALGAIGFVMYRRNAQHWADVMKNSADETKRKVGEAADSMEEKLGKRTDEVTGRKP
ncbi:hypothetical protein Acor_64970 [Acrocarpospora corrugata]|uniref:YtxH domain-containing protein n=2 Tax=Acrocarpospora corrugata TaxID=35763 RepID=A0A5M3W7V8_9ACTN|nr:hypothetical protein Acor_64970 [Acrocarpospora corrugata]